METQNTESQNVETQTDDNQERDTQSVEGQDTEAQNGENLDAGTQNVDNQGAETQNVENKNAEARPVENQVIAKNSKKVLLVVAAGVVCVALVAGGVHYAGIQKEAKEFQVPENIQDDVEIQTENAEIEFNIAESVAQSTPVIAEQTVEDIDSFKNLFSQNVEESNTANAKSVIIPNISALFPFNSAEPYANGVSLLKEYANVYLSTNREAVINIDGYTCNIGSDEVNYALSKNRAEKAKQILISAGVPQNKIEIHWYGKSRNNTFSYPTIEEYRRVIVSIKQ